MTRSKLGSVSILPKGEFKENTLYPALSIVTYNKIPYISNKDTQNAPTNLEGKLHDDWYELFDISYTDSYMFPIDNETIIVNSDGKISINPEYYYNKTITFDPNDNSDTFIINVLLGTKISDYNIPVLSKENYVFDGWYTEASDGEQLDTDEIISSDTVLTYYAHWSAENGD